MYLTSIKATTKVVFRSCSFDCFEQASRCTSNNSVKKTAQASDKENDNSQLTINADERGDDNDDDNDEVNDDDGDDELYDDDEY